MDGPKVERHCARKIDDAKLKKLWSSRMSDCDLAKEMGHHRYVLRRRAKKLGLLARRVLWAGK